MNFISNSVLFFVLTLSATSYSQVNSVVSQLTKKTALEICAEKKLKDLRVRTLVGLQEEPIYLNKFKRECVKAGLAKPSHVEAFAMQAEEAALAAQKEKNKDIKNSTSVAPVKPAVAAVPPVTPTKAPSASTYNGPVIGGCGSPEQCAAVMREANTPKYTWSSPGLQAYLGELWGNSFNYYSGLGGTYEQPDSICTEKNQGELIAFDMGTEVRPVACMSSFATQEEIKAMAAKIKTVKVDTLPTVVAVKKAQYQCKVTKEPKTSEKGEIFYCNGTCECNKEVIGKVWNGGDSRCGEEKCIRIDGGPVKPKTAKKDEDKPKESTAQPAVEPRAPASTQHQFNTLLPGEGQ
jgi:hypothetical protein